MILRGKEKRKAGACSDHAHQLRESPMAVPVGSVHQENKISSTATMPSEDFLRMGNAYARI